MARVHWGWYALVMFMLLPRSASAIQLRWSSGSCELNFATAIRCTLEVRPDSVEQRLPSEWRLLWVADSCDVRAVPLDPPEGCPEDVAEVASLEDAASAADSSAHLRTAHLCSAGESAATLARFVLDLPAGSAGKLRVVAIDPSDPDSSRIAVSPEVIFNGGAPGDYAPVLLHASTIHQSTAFRLTAVGSGLAGTRQLALVAADGSWALPLELESRSESSLTGTASLASNVPACIVEGLFEGGTSATVELTGEPEPQLFSPESGCDAHFSETLYPLDMIQPKDFAFVPGGWTPWGSWTFHLFYIRLNQETSAHHGGIDFTEKNIGHAVSSNLRDWWVGDTAGVRTRGGRFDSLHVWAPSIVRRGLTYYMFYAAEDENKIQRIGLATSTDLVNWVQGDSILVATGPSHTGPGQVPWADATPQGPYGGKTQLRDPFVMEDPESPGSWLMYFATVSEQYSPQMVVGVARSSGNFESWGSTFPLWNTAFPYPSVSETTSVESPHAFRRNGNWQLFYTVDHDSIWAEANEFTPVDTVSAGARWSQPAKLRNLVPQGDAGTFNFWHASEYLEFPHPGADTISYLAAWGDAYQGIGYIKMGPADPPYLFAVLCASDSALAVDGVTPSIRIPRLVLTGLRPARSLVGMRVELPGRMRVHLAVYDVLGRRVHTLVDGELQGGTTELSWDGHDRAGGMVGSGVYFLCLTAPGGRSSVRVPLIR